ncbi:MAG TPA: STAS domain-containing protein [Burkholderiales bacterium]|nr:STAS domain-containing protein [Burkholderiales bacterium]
MELREEIAGEVAILDVKGRIDSTTASTLGDRLSAALAMRDRRLVLDLRQLEYISSAGFRVLLLAARRADESASRLVLCGLSSKVQQLFDLGGFLDFFQIASSRDDAISAAK